MICSFVLDLQARGGRRFDSSIGHASSFPDFLATRTRTVFTLPSRASSLTVMPTRVGLLGLRVDDHHVGAMDRSLSGDDASLLALLRCTHVLLDDLHAFDDQSIVGEHLLDGCLPCRGPCRG